MMLFDNFQSLLRCPITGKFFLDPVIAGDGYFYERNAILLFFKNTSLSPITRQPISKKLIRATFLKNIVDTWLQMNPDMGTEKYFEDLTYLTNRTKIISLMTSGKFVDLLQYDKYVLLDSITISTCGCGNCKNKNDPTTSFIFFVLQKCNDMNIIDHILNNSIDFNKWIESKDPAILSEFAKKNNSDQIFKKLLDLGFDPEQSFDGKRPIHFAAISLNYNVIDILIERNIDLYAKDSIGRTFFDILISNGCDTKYILKISSEISGACMERLFVQSIKYGYFDVTLSLSSKFPNIKNIIDTNKLAFDIIKNSNDEVVHFFLDNDIDISMNLLDENKLSVLHHACSRNNLEIIIKILSKIDVNDVKKFKHHHGWTIMNFAAYYSKADVIYYFLFDLDLGLNTIVTSLSNKSVNYCITNLLELNGKIKSSDREGMIQTILSKIDIDSAIDNNDNMIDDFDISKMYEEEDNNEDDDCNSVSDEPEEDNTDDSSHTSNNSGYDYSYLNGY